MKRADWKQLKKPATVKKPLFSFRCDADLIRRVKALAKTNGSTQQAIVEFAIDAFLEHNDPKRLKTAAPDAPKTDLFD